MAHMLDRRQYLPSAVVRRGVRSFIHSIHNRMYEVLISLSDAKCTIYHIQDNNARLRARIRHILHRSRNDNLDNDTSPKGSYLPWQQL